MIGQKISHYEILEKLGEGGMGVVYKATDTKLNRPVALKFLPVHTAPSAPDQIRFLQEAQAAASLSHPNICTIYGVEEADKKHFIVMEFVDGRMLEEMKASLNQKQAIEIGIQIAEGLAAAHERGIVHRDLKPENIMINKDGRVQIMDFGLAKLRGASRLTKEGSTVGTAGYMSPEQVQGQETDHRSDIFSLGVLLFEMLTGQAPFKGVHETAIAYEIVNVESPPMSSIKVDISPELDAIVLECLEKDPNERTQAAKQVAIDLKRHKRESSKSRLSRTMPAQPLKGNTSRQLTEKVATGGGPRSFVWPAVAAISVLSAALLAWSPWDVSAFQRPVMRFSIELDKDQLMGFNTSGFDMSADGRYIVHGGGAERVGSTQLFLRRTDQLTSLPISGTRNALYPSFSPNGQWIAYEVNGALMKISVFGGAPQKLCDTKGQLRGIAWADDRTVLFGHINRGVGRVSAEGGDPQFITALDSSNGDRSHRSPQLLPDGNTLIFTVKQSTITSFDDAQIVAERLNTGERTILVRGGSYGRFVPTGHLVYLRGGSILAVPFDPSSLKILGQPVEVEKGGWLNQASGDGYFAFSTTGVLVFIPSEPAAWENSTLSWVDRNGRVSPLLETARSYFNGVISPDGQKAATHVQAANDDIWIYHLNRKTFTRFTFGGGNFASPLWSPDGMYVTYLSERGPANDVFRKRWDGSGVEERLSSGLSASEITSYTPDGKSIAFVQGGDIWILPLDGDTSPRPVVRTGANETRPMFSPDGRWLAYSSDESGRNEIYIVPYPSGDGKRQVSGTGGTYPLWTRNGKELLYVNGQTVMSASISDGTRFDFDAPRKVVTLPGSTYLVDVAPDGQRFMIVVDHSESLAQSRLTVVLEWFDELRAKTSGNGGTR